MTDVIRRTVDWIKPKKYFVRGVLRVVAIVRQKMYNYCCETVCLFNIALTHKCDKFVFVNVFKNNPRCKNKKLFKKIHSDVA